MFSKCVPQLGREEISMKMPRWWWQDGVPFQRGGLRWYFWRQMKRFCLRKCSTLFSGNCSNGGNSHCNIQLCMWFRFHLWQEPYNVNFDHIQKLLHHLIDKICQTSNQLCSLSLSTKTKTISSMNIHTTLEIMLHQFDSFHQESQWSWTKTRSSHI